METKIERYKVIDLKKSARHIEEKLNHLVEIGYALYRFESDKLFLMYITQEELNTLQAAVITSQKDPDYIISKN